MIQWRLALRVALLGALAYVCVLPVEMVWLTFWLNVRAVPLEIVQASVAALFFVLRFGLFLVAGLMVGRKTAGARVANAAIVGVMLAVGVMLVDSIILLLLPRGHMSVGSPHRLPTAGAFTGVYYPPVWFGLEIALAVLGGWVASRRRPGD